MTVSGWAAFWGTVGQRLYQRWPVVTSSLGSDPDSGPKWRVNEDQCWACLSTSSRCRSGIRARIASSKAWNPRGKGWAASRIRCGLLSGSIRSALLSGKPASTFLASSSSLGSE
jgi:hypothetical protein